MGRKPRPAPLKLLEGQSPGRDSGGREVPLPPAFARLAPDPPEFLSAEARAEWDRIVPELERLELLKLADRAALAAYCETWSRFVAAAMDVRVNGYYVDGSKGQPVRSPAVAVLEAAGKELRAWASEFGLTPVAELRLSLARDSDDDENPFAGGADAAE